MALVVLLNQSAWKKSAYIDHPFESFSVSDIFETMLIVSAGVAGPLPAFDVPVADSRGVAVIVVVVLKDAIMPEASIRRWRGSSYQQSLL